jgi:hypothetical protein
MRMPKINKARSEGNQFIAIQHTAPANNLGADFKENSAARLCAKLSLHPNPNENDGATPSVSALAVTKTPHRRLRIRLVQIRLFRLCPSISTPAKVSHYPQPCLPDWRGPGFPSSRYCPGRRMRLSQKAERSSPTPQNGTGIRDSVGERPAVSLGTHANVHD